MEIEYKQHIVNSLYELIDRKTNVSNVIDYIESIIDRHQEYSYAKGRKDENKKSGEAVAYITKRNLADLENGLRVPLIQRDFYSFSGVDGADFKDRTLIIRKD